MVHKVIHVILDIQTSRVERRWPTVYRRRLVGEYSTCFSSPFYQPCFVKEKHIIEGVSSKPRLSHILIKIEVRCKRSSSGDSLSIFGIDATLGLMIGEKSRLKKRPLPMQEKG